MFKINISNNVQDHVLHINAVQTIRVGILLASGKHLHDGIISIRGEVWANQISLTLPLVIEVHVQSRQRQECERIDVSILPLSMIFQIDFGTVLTMWYYFFISIIL
jgi:hypothetical protein